MIVLRSAAILEWIKDVQSNPQGVELAEMMDEVNPPKNDYHLGLAHTNLKFKNIGEDIRTKY